MVQPSPTCWHLSVGKNFCSGVGAITAPEGRKCACICVYVCACVCLCECQRVYVPNCVSVHEGDCTMINS